MVLIGSDVTSIIFTVTPLTGRPTGVPRSPVIAAPHVCDASSTAVMYVTGSASVAPYGVDASPFGIARLTSAKVAAGTAAPAIKTRLIDGNVTPVRRVYSAILCHNVGEPNEDSIPRSHTSLTTCAGSNARGLPTGIRGKTLATPRAILKRENIGKRVRSRTPPSCPRTSRITLSCSANMAFVYITPFGVPVAPEVNAMSALSSAFRDPSRRRIGSGTGLSGAFA